MARRIQRTSPAPGARQAQGGPRPAGAAPPKTRRLGGRVSSNVITDFTLQMATLSEAGIPVVKALRILEGQTDPGPFKDVLLEITDDVSAGAPLSEAMSKHRRAFDPLYSSMVRAGEVGGILDRVLQRLAIFREKAAEIRSKVFSALIYPTILLTVAVLVVALVIVFVVPRFREIFDSFDVDLPRPTQILLDVGDFASAYWYLILVAPVVLLLLHRLLVAKNQRYRRATHALTLKIPILGGVLRRALTASFTRTFGTLVQAGVPHLDALEICRDTSSNEVLTEAVEDIRKTVREGEGIARPMGETGLFDDVVVNMVDVGEETGELDTMLLKVADAYEAQVDRRLDALLKIFEPAIMLVMATLIGGLLVALIMPMMQIIRTIGSEA